MPPRRWNPFTTADADSIYVTITFFVTEGTQVLVDDVDMQGVTAFKLKKIKKLMKTRRKKVFKQDVLAKDVDEITKFYKNHGYQNVKVLEPKQTFNADKTRITISVTRLKKARFSISARPNSAVTRFSRRPNSLPPSNTKPATFTTRTRWMRR